MTERQVLLKIASSAEQAKAVATQKEPYLPDFLIQFFAEWEAER